MQRPVALSQWMEEITSGLLLLAETQALVLAQWCLAMDGSCRPRRSLGWWRWRAVRAYSAVLSP